MSSRYGLSTGPEQFQVGLGTWTIAWSPQQVHPYALQWLRWAASVGPSPQLIPDPDVWHYTLLTQDIH